MHLINSDKRNYINLVSYLVLSLPLSLIFSRFTADLSIVILSIMFFFIRGENKIFENKFLSIGRSKGIPWVFFCFIKPYYIFVKKFSFTFKIYFFYINSKYFISLL